jgi:hypothetical protein
LCCCLLECGRARGQSVGGVVAAVMIGAARIRLHTHEGNPERDAIGVTNQPNSRRRIELLQQRRLWTEQRRDRGASLSIDRGRIVRLDLTSQPLPQPAQYLAELLDHANQVVFASRGHCAYSDELSHALAEQPFAPLAEHRERLTQRLAERGQ